MYDFLICNFFDCRCRSIEDDSVLNIEDPITNLNVTENVSIKLLTEFVESCGREVSTIETAIKNKRIVGLLKKILR